MAQQRHFKQASDGVFSICCCCCNCGSASAMKYPIKIQYLVNKTCRTIKTNNLNFLFNTLHQMAITPEINRSKYNK